MIPSFDELDKPNPWPVCEMFAILAGTDERDDPECKACDHLEIEHASAGRRALSTEAIVAIRELTFDQACAVSAAQAIADQAFFEAE